MPVITPTPTALNIIIATAAVAIKGFILVFGSDMAGLLVIMLNNYPLICPALSEELQTFILLRRTL
jgi:hypothetical protein